ncbi:MAG: ribonuclease III [Tepidanaerobacter acetatoxydans]|uniref:ribonuclease III n=1 Tax=Tepidanaerobacter TaxID=499228 RepID=UPI000A4F1A2C|nr:MULTISPECIES: ribonuclease III [Tepidanaerobacter]NLU10905.1 ribonuclease III [Tepidanaerobacter acetatoxydans]
MCIDEKRLQQLMILQENIGIRFSNLNTLNQAFIHPSLTNEKEKPYQENNQRLEFLGDAVLELSISEYLYRHYDFLTEGQMTKIRAFTVCESSLAQIARQLFLGDYLILSKGEENTGGREKVSILADTLEALIGAIYIDKNYKTTYDFIIKNLEAIIFKAIQGEWGTDYKTDLQELLQKFNEDKIIYNVVKESGPDHDKLFYVEVVWKNKVLGTGIGKSKKQAEQNAAKEALYKMNNEL